MLQVTLMTILHKRTENFQIRFLENLNVHPELYLNGSLITRWNQIETNAIFSPSSLDMKTKLFVSSVDTDFLASQLIES